MRAWLAKVKHRYRTRREIQRKRARVWELRALIRYAVEYENWAQYCLLRAEQVALSNEIRELENEVAR